MMLDCSAAGGAFAQPPFFFPLPRSGADEANPVSDSDNTVQGEDVRAPAPASESNGSAGNDGGEGQAQQRGNRPERGRRRRGRHSRGGNGQGGNASGLPADVSGDEA